VNKAIRAADATIAESSKKIERIASERDKFQAAYDAAFQSSDILRAKVGRYLALVAVGEASQKDADAAAAELAAAESKRDTFKLTLAGLDEQEAAARTAIEASRQGRAAAVKAACEARLDQVAGEYLAAAQAFVGALRKAHAIGRVLRSLEPGRTVFASEFDSAEVIVPALVHELHEPHRRGLANASLYSARGELGPNFMNGDQGAALQAELDLLREQGIEV